MSWKMENCWFTASHGQHENHRPASIGWKWWTLTDFSWMDDLKFNSWTSKTFWLNLKDPFSWKTIALSFTYEFMMMMGALWAVKHKTKDVWSVSFMCQLYTSCVHTWAAHLWSQDHSGGIRTVGLNTFTLFFYYQDLFLSVNRLLIGLCAEPVRSQGDTVLYVELSYRIITWY